MANYAYKADKLTDGDEILVRGKIGFSRITSRIEGADLAKSDQRKVQNGMRAVGKPHTTMTLSEPTVLFGNPQQPTYAENFVQERFYISKKYPERGMQYTIISKGNNLPIIAVPEENGQGFAQDTSGRELANGLDVTVQLRVYKIPTEENRGLSLDAVFANEPVRYYSPGGLNLDNLAARGLVFTTPPRAVRADQATSTGPVPTEDFEDDLPLPQAAPAQGGAYAQPQQPGGYPQQQQGAHQGYQQAPQAQPGGYQPQAPQGQPQPQMQQPGYQQPQQQQAPQAQPGGAATAVSFTPQAVNPNSAFAGGNPWPAAGENSWPQNGAQAQQEQSASGQTGQPAQNQQVTPGIALPNQG